MENVHCTKRTVVDKRVFIIKKKDVLKLHFKVQIGGTDYFKFRRKVNKKPLKYLPPGEYSTCH